MILSTCKIKDMEMIEVEKERRIKYLSLITLIVAVLGLTVAFAALSQTLTINGTANVNAVEWDIHFANLKEAEITATAREESKPTLTNNGITGLNVSLTKPGDKIVYTFDVVNNGSINASLQSVYKATSYISILCAMGTASTDPNYFDYDLNGDGSISGQDTKILTQAIDYNLYYEDGITKLKEGDTLNVGETKKIKLIIEYKDTAEIVFNKPLKIFDDSSKFELYYEQAN